MSWVSKMVERQEDLLVAKDFLLSRGFETQWVEEPDAGLDVYTAGFQEYVGRILFYYPEMDGWIITGTQGPEVVTQFPVEEDPLEAAEELLARLEAGVIWPRVLWYAGLEARDEDEILAEKPYLAPFSPEVMDTWGWDRIEGEGFDGLVFDGVMPPPRDEVVVVEGVLDWEWLNQQPVDRPTGFSVRARGEDSPEAHHTFWLQAEVLARVLRALQRAIEKNPKAWDQALRYYRAAPGGGYMTPADVYFGPFVTEYVDIEGPPELFRQARYDEDTLHRLAVVHLQTVANTLSEPSPRKLKNRLLS